MGSSPLAGTAALHLGHAGCPTRPACPPAGWEGTPFGASRGGRATRLLYLEQLGCSSVPPTRATWAGVPVCKRAIKPQSRTVSCPAGVPAASGDTRRSGSSRPAHPVQGLGHSLEDVMHSLILIGGVVLLGRTGVLPRAPAGPGLRGGARPPRHDGGDGEVGGADLAAGRKDLPVLLHGSQ